MADSMRCNKWLGALVALAAFSPIVAFTGCGGDESVASLPAKPESPAAKESLPADPPAEAVAATEKSALQTIALLGSLEPHRRSVLTPRVSGAVTKVLVREGDRVKKGDALVYIDLRDFELRLKDAEAAQDAAAANADNARLQFDRQKSLYDDKAIPQSRMDELDAAMRAAGAQLARTEAAVETARKALSDAVVRAPFDALVTERHVDEGEYAAVTPARTLITVEEIGTIDLRIAAPAPLLGRIHVGDPVVAVFKSAGKTIESVVTRVVPSLDPKTRTFTVLVEIENADGALDPGLFADVQFPELAESAETKSP